ncbi:MAG: type II toxin-antitoxin system prevent-host-death family antitoxin [Magnetococcales bacterium]|nr:type II toxin-antitoxin system prevent-host-death family antitoxin [Magnetococcales bacterium]
MVTVSVVQAKTQLDELLNRVAAGEEVVITRQGDPVATLSALPRLESQLLSLQAFRADMPAWSDSSARLLRDMRDEEL